MPPKNRLIVMAPNGTSTSENKRGSPIDDWLFILSLIHCHHVRCCPYKLWEVENQVAQRREQLIQNGMPPEQLENVLAEFRKQEIKAAKDAKAVTRGLRVSWRG